MKKITLAKPAKEANSNVVLYAYTREGGSLNGQCIPVGNIGCPTAGDRCPINFICW